MALAAEVPAWREHPDDYLFVPEAGVAMAGAIRARMWEIGLSRHEFVDLCSPARDRSAIYRLLAGGSIDMRISTLVLVCRVLRITPTALLARAGLWP